MVKKDQPNRSHEIRHRAAEIRKHWSPVEKLRRTGLPPDMPTKLREFFTASRPQHAWCAIGASKEGQLK